MLFVFPTAVKPASAPRCDAMLLEGRACPHVVPPPLVGSVAGTPEPVTDLCDAETEPGLEMQGRGRWLTGGTHTPGKPPTGVYFP